MTFFRLKPEATVVGLKPEATVVGLKPEATVVGLKPEATVVGLKPGATVVGLRPGATLVIMLFAIVLVASGTIDSSSAPARARYGMVLSQHAGASDIGA